MRIAIVALGSRGDVQPRVAIGKGLRRAGHSVRVVTHPPFEEFVRGNGLDFSSLGGNPRAAGSCSSSTSGPPTRRSGSSPMRSPRSPVA
ncbi:MAG TPA: glycosyltransferase [Candidatus Eisenbacteria bacterium]|nr:glycosyltransferase [Candidatus Eisenbacteria bacterium]